MNTTTLIYVADLIFVSELRIVLTMAREKVNCCYVDFRPTFRQFYYTSMKATPIEKKKPKQNYKVDKNRHTVHGDIYKKMSVYKMITNHKLLLIVSEIKFNFTYFSF